MNDFFLVRKNLSRNKLRLFLNSTAILVAFLLFGILTSLNYALSAGVELTADNRMVVVNKINFTQPLPYAYFQKVSSVQGVAAATHLNWFGGYYQDGKNQIISFAVNPNTYFDVYKDALVDTEELKAWKNTRQGALIGEKMALARGWKIGDKIPLSSNIFTQKDGSYTWDLEVVGIIRPENPKVDSNYLLLHYKYFIETQSFGDDWIGWMAILTEDASQNELVAKAIDNQFANSSAETETTSEKQFAKSFLEQFGNIGLILTSVVGAAFFTILLIVGNSMALAIRERTREIAVLKTLGFSAKRVFKMVLSESLLLAFVGGLIGLSLAGLVVIGCAVHGFIGAYHRLGSRVAGDEVKHSRRTEQELNMQSTTNQIKAVVNMNLLSLPHRLWMSLATIIAVAIVVGVLLAFLAMSVGFQKTVGNRQRLIAALAASS